MLIIEQQNDIIRNLREQLNKNYGNSSKPPASNGLKKKRSIRIEVCEREAERNRAVRKALPVHISLFSRRKNPWEYDKELYKRRNEVERYFLRIKRFRRVFTRYDKLDVLYLGNLTLAMIFDAILM